MNLPSNIKVFELNYTPVANYILDNMSEFTDGELRVLLVVTRKTIGWHKETDYLTYSQIIELTAKSKQTVSLAVQALVKKKLILRIGQEGEDLTIMPQSYRKKIYYTLNKEAVHNALEKKNNDRSKIHTGTGLKFIPYKRNVLQKKLELAEPKPIKKDKKVDNSQRIVDNSKHESRNTLQRISSDRVEKLRTVQHPPSDRVSTAHQAYGIAALQQLALPETYTARIIKACKGKPYHVIHHATQMTIHRLPQIETSSARAKYFFKVLSTPSL